MVKFMCKFGTKQDLDMLMFIELAICGGVSQCRNRFAVAKNKYSAKSVHEKPNVRFMYFDVNTLCV